MAINSEKYISLVDELKARASLVAVSKTKPIKDILQLYELGQRDFGENYAQELAEKAALLPKDIRWHFIGHLQSNKVKYIAPFIYLVHGVDSMSLLKEINKQGIKNDRIVACLLQVHIAKEETKFGFDEAELNQLPGIADLKNIRTAGLMGMASFSEDKELVRTEFAYLKSLFDLKTNLFSKAEEPTGANSAWLKYPVLSMGMSGDYTIALEEGSNMVRIGSLLFGERNQKN